jgi:hypothetical protein
MGALRSLMPYLVPLLWLLLTGAEVAAAKSMVSVSMETTATAAVRRAHTGNLYCSWHIERTGGVHVKRNQKAQRRHHQSVSAERHSQRKLVRETRGETCSRRHRIYF